MLNIGALVRHKSSGLQQDRRNPRKKFGIVIAIERQEIKSLWGLRQDMVTVKWMPWDHEEKLTEACLELMGGK